MSHEWTNKQIVHTYTDGNEMKNNTENDEICLLNLNFIISKLIEIKNSKINHGVSNIVTHIQWKYGTKLELLHHKANK